MKKAICALVIPFLCLALIMTSISMVRWKASAYRAVTLTDEAIIMAKRAVKIAEEYKNAYDRDINDSNNN